MRLGSDSLKNKKFSKIAVYFLETVSIAMFLTLRLIINNSLEDVASICIFGKLVST